MMAHQGSWAHGPSRPALPLTSATALQGSTGALPRSPLSAWALHQGQQNCRGCSQHRATQDAAQELLLWLHSRPAKERCSSAPPSHIGVLREAEAMGSSWWGLRGPPWHSAPLAQPRDLLSPHLQSLAGATLDSAPHSHWVSWI